MRKSTFRSVVVALSTFGTSATLVWGQASQITARVDNNGELASDMNTAGNGSTPLGVNAPFGWTWDANTAGTGRGTVYVSGSSANGFAVKGETELQSTEANPVPDGHSVLFGGGTSVGQSLLYQNITSVAGRHYWMVGSERINTGSPNNSKPNWGLTNGSSPGAGVSPAGTGGFSYGTNVGRNGNFSNGMVATGSTITAQFGLQTTAGPNNINAWFDGIRVIESNINVYSSLQNGDAETTPTNVTATWDPSGTYGGSPVRSMSMFDGWLPMGGAIGNIVQTLGDVGTGKGGTGRSITMDGFNSWGRQLQFQRVLLAGKTSYTFSADVQAFGSVSDARIGIDPTGGTDPNSANIIWSAPNSVFGSTAATLAQWQTQTVSVNGVNPLVGVSVWLADGYTGANNNSAATTGARFDNMLLVPEPTTLVLLGLSSVLLSRRRRA